MSNLNTLCNHSNKYSFFRCLAHIINLATQTLISTRSKAKYYSADAEEDHIPDLDAFERDEVGLVREVTVKVSMYLHLNMSVVFLISYFRRGLQLNARNYSRPYNPVRENPQSNCFST